jgi:hypothetical protein
MAEAQGVKQNIVAELKDRSENADRAKEKGIVNDKTGGSLLIDQSGNVTIAASKTVQYKMNYSQGQTTEISMQSNTITNRRNIIADEITVNKHKLNPQLYHLTDMKRYQGDPTSAIGNLTMYGTVLVKTWEPTLEKWVLMRRPMRTPIFSNVLPIPDVPASMGLSGATDISTEITQMRDVDKLNQEWM